MGVLPVLVLGEEDGILELADVVIEGTGTDQLRPGSQPVGHLGCEIGYLHAMVEGAVGFLGKTSKQGIVDVLKLDERDDAGKAENALDGDEQQVGQHGEHASHGEEDVGHPADDTLTAIGCAANELEAKIGEQGCQGDPDGGPEELDALREFTQGIDGYESCHNLHHDEREGLW